MGKFGIILLFSATFFFASAQEVSLPVDFRQHNLTEYNSSFFNPAFSLDRNNPQSVSFWTRWQWQSIDADPTTLFLNYTRKINESSAASAAFFQHNTGVFFNTGGILNYAKEIRLNSLIRLGFGFNLFGFQQELADDRFQIDPDLPLPVLQPTTDFILQLAPGIRLSVENFAFSLAAENLFDYNFTDKERNTVPADKIYMGMVSYDIPVSATSDPTAFLRPSLYLRTIPELDNQVGLNVLLSKSVYWAQLGYNNFYGISVGGGGTFFKRFSVGALVEFGTNSAISSEDPSFELVASYFIGKPEERRKIRTLEEEELPKTEELITEEKTQEEIKKAEALAKEEKAAERARQKQAANEAKELAAQERVMARQKRRDSIAAAKEERAALAEANRIKEEREKAAREQAEREQELANARDEQQRKLDSINESRRAEALAAAQRLRRQKETDSLANLKTEQAEENQEQTEEAQIVEQAEESKPKVGEKYEEVLAEGDLEPGYYLITNVFGTKKYYDAFMKDLQGRGLQPGSFVRARNNYNYVYLARYNTMNEAREARDSNFGGKYPDKTWIFRVVGN